MRLNVRIWLLKLIAIFLYAGSHAAIAADKRIMVFGDSNSWGLAPVDTVVPVTRYSKDLRWVGAMANQLGGGYEVVNESLSGRTAATDDPSFGISGAGMNGLQCIPAALASHAPLDLVIIMLGTNDIKPNFAKTPLDISLDIMRVVSEVRRSTGVATNYTPPRVLVISPRRPRPVALSAQRKSQPLPGPCATPATQTTASWTVSFPTLLPAPSTRPLCGARAVRTQVMLACLMHSWRW